MIENAAEAAASRITVVAGPDGDRYAVTVSDDGPGPTDAIAPRIFDAFFTSKDGHAGLGLNIARRIARRYGGDVGLPPERVAGRGACLVLSLPLVDESEIGAAAGLRVLVVDDDQSNLITLSALLEGEGFVTDTAASFAVARAMLGASDARYDVVLLDQNLGDGKGAALLPIVRERLPACRAMLISGSVDEAEVARVGFDAFLFKSTPFPEVFAAVLTMVGRANAAGGEAAATPHAESSGR